MTKLFSKVKESIEGIKMPSTLTINGKAPIVAYAELHDKSLMTFYYNYHRFFAKEESRW